MTLEQIMAIVYMPERTVIRLGIGPYVADNNKDQTWPVNFHKSCRNDVFRSSTKLEVQIKNAGLCNSQERFEQEWFTVRKILEEFLSQYLPA